MILLEVIATRLEDAVAAERGGADRIELVTGMLEGGLTPSIGLIERVARTVRIPVNVMVRPHSLSFRYSEADVGTMLADIRRIRETGAAGIVLGALNADRTIDVATMRALLDEAGGLDVTFHRAFDEAADPLAALETLTSQFPQIGRVLTSGLEPTALQGAALIARLVRAAEPSGLRILAGAGLKAESLRDFVRRTGVREVHFGSAVREDGHPLQPIDPARLAAVRAALAELEAEA